MLFVAVCLLVFAQPSATRFSETAQTTPSKNGTIAKAASLPVLSRRQG
jgi:hypothetical protein